MRLFFKHLINSIRAKPLQPLILVLTLLLSMMVNVSVFSLRGYLDEETLQTQKAQYGRADITVSLNGTSQSRFMFTKDANELLDDKASVAGCYELPLAVGQTEETAFGVAVNFTEVGNIFDLEFSEYGKTSEAEINDVAFISRAFAKEYGLSLGEAFAVKALGYDKTYSVAGISETRFLASYDVMVNITGVMRLLASDSLFVSALGDDFQPCSTIYIDVKDGVSTQACIDLLKTDGNFAEKSFTVVSSVVDTWMSADIADITINVLLILTGALSATVVFCCFYILSAQRTEENAVFKAAGAKPWRLVFLQYAEILLYWLVGGGIGLLCTLPVLHLVVGYTKFQFVLPRLDVLNAVKGGVLLLLEALLTTTVFVISEKLRQKPGRKGQGIKMIGVVFFAIFVLLFPGIFLVPIAWRLSWSLVCGIFLLLTAFVGVPVLFRWVVERWDAQGFGEKSVPLRYAVKNVCGVKVLHNTCRLSALIGAILCCIVLAIVSVNGYVADYNTFLKGDFVVVNGTESCRQKVEACESVGHVYSIYFGAASQQGTSMQLLSVSDIGALSDELSPTQLPQGNEAVLGEAYANMADVEVGDPLTVRMNGKKYSFVISEITKSGLPIILFDSTYFGLSYNMLSVDGARGVSESGLRQALTSATALELAAVISTQELMTTRLQIVSITLRCGDFLLPFVTLFALIGMLDNLAESYRARKEEFGLYAVCGMSKKEIARMKISELFLVVLFGTCIGFVVFGASAVILNQALQSVGFGLFINL